jgi:hypothetical protein
MGSYDVANSVSESMMTSAIAVDASPEAFIEWTPTNAIGSKYCSATFMSES